MITIILTCLILAGGSLTLTPPTGWEVVRVIGMVVATQPAGDARGLMPTSADVARQATLPSPDCFQVHGAIQCPAGRRPGTLVALPPPAEQVEVTVRRVVLVGDALQTPKGCQLRIESGEEKQ